MTRHFKKIVEDIGSQLGNQNQPNIRQQLQLNIKEFADKVAAFNQLGEALYNGGNFAKLAEDLEEISNSAEAYTLRETGGEWFDQVTVKRNMKELKGYSGEFKKVASEARALQERMTALYEDCGRVLGRYFEIKEFNQPDGMTTEPQPSQGELQVNTHPGVREGVIFKTPQQRKQDRLTKLDQEKNELFSRKHDLMTRIASLSNNVHLTQHPEKPGEHAGKFVSNPEAPQKLARAKEELQNVYKKIDDVVKRMHDVSSKPVDVNENGGSWPEDFSQEEREKVHKKTGMSIPKPTKPKFTSQKPPKPKVKEGTMCDECGKSYDECAECREVNEADKKWIQKAVNPAHKGYCTPMTKSTCTPRRKALARRFKKGIDKEAYIPTVKENVSPTGGKPAFKSLKLKKIVEDINDDRPKDDWVKLDVPMLRYDVALDFEKDLKKKGFDVRRHDWKERAGQGEEFSEFWVKKDDFNDANLYAVGAYPQFDNNARMSPETEKKPKVSHL